MAKGGNSGRGASAPNMSRPRGTVKASQAVAARSAWTVAVVASMLPFSNIGLVAAPSLSPWCLAGKLLASLLRRDWHWRALKLFLGLLLAASIVTIWL